MKKLEGLVLIDFWAPWCGPCKMLAPVLEELKTEEDINIQKVNVDEEQSLAAQYGIMSIPTLVLLKDGDVVDKTVGFQPKEVLSEWIHRNQ